MPDIRLQSVAALLSLFCGAAAHAQQSQPTAIVANTAGVPTRAVPTVIRFTGSFRPSNGMATQPVESVTISVYRDQIGGTALWQETQNVAVDGEGKYSVLMGSTQNDGVPLDLLSAGEPRWLGAQFNRPGEVEQPRVLMASVPYALKSVDAETLGGRPASAYLLAPSGTNAPGTNTSSGVTASGIAATTGVTTPATVLTNTTTAVKSHATTGTAGFIGVFTDATDIGNSVMQQSNGSIGVGTVPGANAATTPSLDVRTAPFSQIGMAQTVDYLTFFASDAYGPAIYWDPTNDLRLGKGGAGLYNAFGFTEQMRIQSSTGNVGIGTQTPQAKLDVAGDINFNGSILYQGSPLIQISGGVGGLDNLFNFSLGNKALASITSGHSNIAIGSQALQFTTTGGGNTSTGSQALFRNIGGNENTATGHAALANNTTGGNNTATGSGALLGNTTGSNNTATGINAMFQNGAGFNNTAIGDGALTSNTTGSSNTACGMLALINNTTGNFNIAIGLGAAQDVPAGSSNNIHIGSIGSTPDSGTIRIGEPTIQSSFFAAGIRNVTTGNNDAIPVMIDSAGQLGTVSSSRRYKEDIEDMGEASRDLMRLRPVTFRYKRPFADGSKPIQYGLIAEEVDEVYPDLVAHSADGQIETVKYQVLDSMLLNEVQKQVQHAQLQDETIRQQHEVVLQQQEQVSRQQHEIRSLEARLAALEALLSGKPPTANGGR